MTSSFPVPRASSDAEVSLGFYPGGKDRILFFLQGKESIVAAGNQGGDAEIQEPLAPHSKFHLSQTTNTVTGFDGVCDNSNKTTSLFISFLFWASSFHLAVCRGSSFVKERHPWVSLPLSVSFCLLPSRRAGVQMADEHGIPPTGEIGILQPAKILPAGNRIKQNPKYPVARKEEVETWDKFQKIVSALP